MSHYACDKRIKEEGGQAKCCECDPHEECQVTPINVPTTSSPDDRANMEVRLLKEAVEENSNPKPLRINDYVTPSPEVCPTCGGVGKHHPTPSPEHEYIQVQGGDKCVTCGQGRLSHLVSPPPKDWKKSGVVRKLHLTVMGAKTAGEAEKAITDTISDLLLEERERITKLAIDSFTVHDEGWGSYCDTGADMEWACRSDCVEHGVERFKKAIASLTHNI